MTETQAQPAQHVNQRVGGLLLLTLGLLAAAAPVTTDLYLPAFPSMREDLATSASGVQLTLTAFMVGAGLGQLVFGPLSDRIGRRGPLIVGLVIYLLAGVAAALAPTVGTLVAARLVQGICGAAGMVIARAIIVDLVTGVAAARALSIMMLVTGMAPVVAPILGGVLADPIGWRGILWVVAGISLVSLTMTLAFVPETHPAERRVRAGSGPGVPLWSKTYVGYALTFALGCSTMMAYIAASPFVYQTMMGLNELQYGLMFGLNAVGLAIGSATSARLVGRVSQRALVRIGLSLNLGAIVLLTVVTLTSAPVVLLAPLLFVAVGSLGLVMGNSTASALAAVPGRGGTASALLGCTQFLLAGLVSALVGLGGEATAVPLALTMLAGSIGAWIAFVVAGRGARA